MIAVPVPDSGLKLHRLLEHQAPGRHDFEPRTSRTQARIRGLPELFRGGLSHWLEHDQAVAASERRTCFVAQLDLEAGTSIRVALTEEWGRGHVDVWAHPDELLPSIVNVVREASP
jgi:hypothetical protein